MKIRYQLQNTTCDKKIFHPPLVLWRSIEKTTRENRAGMAPVLWLHSLPIRVCFFRVVFNRPLFAELRRHGAQLVILVQFHRSQSHFRPKQKHFPRLFQSLSLNSPPSFTYMSNLICKSYSLEIAAWITVVLFPSLHLLFIFNLKANILKHTHAPL